MVLAALADRAVPVVVRMEGQEVLAVRTAEVRRHATPAVQTEAKMTYRYTPSSGGNHVHMMRANDYLRSWNIVCGCPLRRELYANMKPALTGEFRLKRLIQLR